MSKPAVARHGLATQLSSRLYELDRILRGDTTRMDALVRTADGEAEFKIPVVGLSVTVICMAVIYGFCMGTFALVRGAENAQYAQACLQTFASMCKVPLLFFFTLIVTFPSLYVFNALVGSRLRMTAVMKLLIASLAVNLAVLASLGPILAFFSVSTPNYAFIVLLNVVVFSVAGILGLTFLIQTMGRLTASYKREALLKAQARDQARAQKLAVIDAEIVSSPVASKPATSKPEIRSGHRMPLGSAAGTPAEAKAASLQARSAQRVKNGPLDRESNVVLGQHIWKVFWCWLVVFSLVGAQMGWVLRPFIGSPDMPFTWFRARESNFFEAVLNVIQNLLF